MLRTFIFVLLGVAVVIGLLAYLSSGNREVGLPTTSPVVSTEVQEEGGPAVEVLSLPAFSQREFRGSNFTVGRVLDDNSAYTRHYITYKSGELTISGIMNMPKGAGPFPVLVLNHGYIDPTIYTNGRGLKREQDYLARRGYVVVHPDYRNHADSDKDPETDVQFRLGYVEDVINVIKAIQQAKLPRVDASKIGMLGHSMGGGVTLNLLVTQPELAKAAVLFAPVSADQRDNFAKWIARRPEVAERIVAAHGTPEQNPEFWDDISAITFVKSIVTPVLLEHGTSDASVPIAWSERLATALEMEKKDVTFHVYPGEPHEFASAWPTVMERTVQLFDAHLR